MGNPSRRSKRPSATSSRWPPEDLVFFVDRSLGRRYVADALRARGIHVEVHDDHFPPGAKDAEWLPVVGERCWIVIMKDKRIRRSALERDALLRAGVRAFVLTAGNLQGPEMVEVLLANLRRIVHIALAPRSLHSRGYGL